MAKDVKLRSLLHREQGRNFRLEKQKQREKNAEKKRESRKQQQEEEDDSEEDEEVELEGEDAENSGEEEANGGVKLNGKEKKKGKKEAEEDSDEEDDEDWEDDDEENVIDASRLDDSESDSSEDEEEEDEEDEENEEDIPLSDLDSLASDEKGDIIPYQRLTINNKAALLAAVHRIQLPYSTLSFSAHQTITSDEPTVIEDVDDDLARELAFYKQSLTAAVAGRTKLRKEGVSFTRPTDYFAEMVKSDEHMGKIKQKLVDEAAGKKAAAEARRQRDLKKFGKQVQVAKLQERQKSKRETLEKINVLKRKRASGGITNEKEDDLFDVSLEQEIDRPSKKTRGGPGGPDGQSNAKRQKKNEKYGFGGKKRHAKSTDAASSADMRDYPGTKRMKQNFGSRGGAGGAGGAKKRPGKARRAKGKL